MLLLRYWLYRFEKQNKKIFCLVLESFSLISIFYCCRISFVNLFSCFHFWPIEKKNLYLKDSLFWLFFSFEFLCGINLNKATKSMGAENKLLHILKPEMTAEEAPRECAVCSKTVYPVERIFANKCLYHNYCFKCSKCSKKLL